MRTLNTSHLKGWWKYTWGTEDMRNYRKAHSHITKIYIFLSYRSQCLNSVVLGLRWWEYYQERKKNNRLVIQSRRYCCLLSKGNLSSDKITVHLPVCLSVRLWRELKLQSGKDSEPKPNVPMGVKLMPISPGNFTCANKVRLRMHFLPDSYSRLSFDNNFSHTIHSASGSGATQISCYAEQWTYPQWQDLLCVANIKHVWHWGDLLENSRAPTFLEQGRKDTLPNE